MRALPRPSFHRAPLSDSSLSLSLPGFRPAGFKIAVVCSRGELSAQATVRMTKVYGFDHERVLSVQGGINKWIMQGYGVEQTTSC